MRDDMNNTCTHTGYLGNACWYWILLVLRAENVSAWPAQSQIAVGFCSFFLESDGCTLLMCLVILVHATFTVLQAVVACSSRRRMSIAEKFRPVSFFLVYSMEVAWTRSQHSHIRLRPKILHLPTCLPLRLPFPVYWPSG